MDAEDRPSDPTRRSDACTTGLPGSQPEACGTGYTGIPTAEPAFSESAVPPVTPIPAATTFTGKTRRIGTITFGIALIFSGIFCLLCLFVPDFDFLSVLRYAPVLLVFLGIEILVSHFLYPGHRMKYDFLSGFFCFLLILVSYTLLIIRVFDLILKGLFKNSHELLFVDDYDKRGRAGLFDLILFLKA